MNKGIGEHYNLLNDHFLGTMNNLCLLAHNLQFGIVLDDKIDNLSNGLVYMLPIVAYAAYAQSCQLPEVMVLYFSYRDVVLVTKFGYKGLNYSSFILERLIFWYMQFYLTYAGIHLLTNLK